MGIKIRSQKEKRIIKTLMAFIILGNLSYAENLASGTYNDDVVVGKNDGKGTMHSKGDGGGRIHMTLKEM